MTPEQYQEIAEAFDQADALEVAQRELFLRELRAQKPEVAAHVESLLHQECAEETPLAEVAPRCCLALIDSELPIIPPAVVEDQWPAQVGAYQIRGRLGGGGMGVVLRVRDLRFNRPLALKVLREIHKNDEKLKKRFLEEWQIMAQLQHPGVPPVHDQGELPDGRPFFTMKLIKGQTLAALLKDKTKDDQKPPANGQERENSSNHQTPASAPQPPLSRLPRLLPIFEQVCQTIGYAHARRVIHRDLKPGNIMVGAFGEVQVVDWGLAKILHAVEPDLAQSNSDPAEGETGQTTVSTPQAQGAAAHTEPGEVLGTFAYIAPEQGRGEVERLDQRCDVFGLGAILCELLTGKPAFATGHLLENHRLAMKGDLSDAYARLEKCQTDQELIHLAKTCLAPDADDRPPDAGEVARTIRNYQLAVQERLKKAEIEGATAQARAEEEQKRRVVEEARAEGERQRRRATLALAGLAILFVLCASGAGIWYYQDQAHRTEVEAIQNGEKAEQEANQRFEQQAKRRIVEKEASLALDEAGHLARTLHQQLTDPREVHKHLSNMKDWRNTLDKIGSLLQQVRSLANANKALMPSSLIDHFQRLERTWQSDTDDFYLAKELDDIQFMAFTAAKGKSLDTAAVGPSYTTAFKKAGYDPEHSSPPQVAGQIAGASLRYALVAALDHWATVTPDRKLRSRLLEVATRADPDPWRDQVRDVKTWEDLDRRADLAEKVQHEYQTPKILGLLATRLPAPKAEAFLRKALVYHPNDFALLFSLGNLTNDPVKKTGYFLAALAVRPDNGFAYNNLGMTLVAQKDLPGAIQHFKKAIHHNPSFAIAHNNLGFVLAEQKDLPGAIYHYYKAIELDPNDAGTNCNLGVALYAQNNLSEAIRRLNRAILLDPSLAEAHSSLGVILTDQKNFLMAIEHLHKAIELAPNDAGAYCNLGKALIEKGDLDAAIRYLRKAFKLDPKNAAIQSNLGSAYNKKGEYDSAISHLKVAIELEPNSHTAYSNLGWAFLETKDFDAAIQCLKRAVELEPKFAPDFNQLGYALNMNEDFGAAVPYLKRAIVLDSQHVNAHNNLGWALIGEGDPDAAIPYLKRAIELDRTHLWAHNNLGWAYSQKKEYDTAIQYLKKATELDPQSVYAHYKLGSALNAKGDYDKAIASLERAIDLDSKHANAHNNLGWAYTKKKQFDKAISCFKKAINWNPELEIAHDNLALVYQETNQFEDADKYLVELFSLQRKRLPLDHPTVASTLARRGRCLVYSFKAVEAQPILEQCLAIRVKRIPNHWFTSNTRAMLGAALLGQKKYGEAEKLLLEGYEGMEQRKNTKEATTNVFFSQRQLEALEHIVLLYHAWGKKGLADQWAKKLAAAREQSKRKLQSLPK